ncbi:MAG: ATP-dependent Clp protease proteolytic subunit [Actinobacteria bacterium]|nr:ATP-dependent Clp protease proteolytic subunit [Actinomycetota bacterium]
MEILHRNMAFNILVKKGFFLLSLVLALPSISVADVSIRCNKNVLGDNEFWKLVKPSTSPINESYLFIDLAGVDISSALTDKTLSSAEVMSGMCAYYTMTEETIGIVSLDLVGEIKSEDYEVLVDSLRGISEAIADSKRNGSILLNLNSYGGSVSAAIKIGHLLSDYKNTNTSVQPESICASSCVLILAAGETKKIFGKVGIHRIRFVDDRIAKLSKEEYRKEYDSAMNELVSYLKKMGIRASLAEDMMQYSSDEVYYLSDKDIEHYRLNQQNPYVFEQEKLKQISRCGDDWYQLKLQLDEVAKSKCAGLASENEYYKCFDSVYGSLYRMCK